MPLSWNEIKSRAADFVNAWQDKAPNAREEADAQSFQIEFFHIFGVDRKKVAVFENKVKLYRDRQQGLFEYSGTGQSGYIDLLWKGRILIEMKSPGKDLEKAYEQAKNYALALDKKDFPKAILICDFVNFHYYDLLEDGKKHCFHISELVEYIELFGDLAGYTAIEFAKLDPVNIEAAEIMGKLHNRLKETGYSGHQLELYLVRLMFCLFADDTGIFEPPNIFNTYILERTSEDGSDLGLHLQMIFEVLNKPKEKRLKTLDEQLNEFPYINGDLFDERVDTAAFDSAMRDTLIDSCKLDWSRISPAIFGAMFQSVMNEKERHDIGAHYTSEENILKVIRPLFLDNLREEFNKIKALSPALRRERLITFHDKIASLKFLDPACGCGNFLVVSYRELRMLELDVLEILLGKEKVFDIHHEIKVNVNQFYGIETEEFPAQIAQTALWLTDHQMNLLVRERFGIYYVRLPLTVSAEIRRTNALTIDWEDIVPKEKLSYILGNPPFLGYSVMNKMQKEELRHIFSDMRNCGMLDYVSCWYKKAAAFIKDTEIEVAYVSTNSICQGEQVPLLWSELMNKHGIKINFAHQTFKWSNEARGKAAVYCIIIGFSRKEREEKRLYIYTDIKGIPHEISCKRINAYLLDAPDIFIERRLKPLCAVSEILLGNVPRDDGNFFLTKEERSALLKENPAFKEIIRPFLGAHEFLNNVPRYCLWLKDVPATLYKNSKTIQERIKNIRKFREQSEREATKSLADFPTLFSEIRQPASSYILIPRHSSEKRKYIPIGFVKKNIICGDSCSIIPNATLYEFGIITSTMHMAWMRRVCGRLKSDYRYSGVLVYNNFPWPNPKEKQKEIIEKYSQEILDIRQANKSVSLSDLYDVNFMPPALLKAHQKLDKAVETAYGRTFDDDSRRVAYLFELYQKLSGELFTETKKHSKGRKA